MNDTSWGYGPWGGGGHNPWGGGQIKLHYYALKKLFPIQDIQGDFDNDLDIDGKYLDQVYYLNNDLLANEFPDTATIEYNLPDFERIFIANSQGEVLAAEQALINKNGKMNPAFFIALGVSLGYTDVTIHENILDMFILAPSINPPASLLPHNVYEEGLKWTWTIRSLLIDTGKLREQWEYLVTKAAPAWTQIIFQYY